MMNMEQHSLCAYLYSACINIKYIHSVQNDLWDYSSIVAFYISEKVTYEVFSREGYDQNHNDLFLMDCNRKM